MADQRVKYVIEAQNLLSKVLQDIESQANRTDGAVERIGKGSSGKSGFMGSIVGGNLLASGIQRAASAMYDFGASSIDSFKKFEQFGVALTTMFHGNRVEADLLSNQLVNFAKTTPFELTEIQDATRQLIAYGSTSGSVSNELKMLGDISSGVGAPLGEIAYLYGTARTQGRLFSRDIYQFSGRGIPIVEALAKQFGVTKSKVMELVEQGKVGFPQLVKAMQSLTKEGGQFNNMMAAQAKTLGGQTSNLADAWDQLKVSIAGSQQGILKSTVQWATEMVSSIQQNFRINEIVQAELKKMGGAHEVSLLQRLNPFSSRGREYEALYQREGGLRETIDKASGGTVEDIDKAIAKIGQQYAKRSGFFVKTAIRGDHEEGSANLFREVGQLEINAIKELKRMRIEKLKGNAIPGSDVGTGGGKADKSRLGTGTTIESGAPKNMYININKLIETMKIESVNGDIPSSKIRAEVSKVLLEVVSDADKAVR